VLPARKQGRLRRRAHPSFVEIPLLFPEAHHGQQIKGDDRPVKRADASASRCPVVGRSRQACLRPRFGEEPTGASSPALPPSLGATADSRHPPIGWERDGVRVDHG
jgi:hypothetical protein